MPGTVRRWLLPLSFLVFAVGHLISCGFYFSGKPFDIKSAIISDLESPYENPHGYGAGAAGTALCGLLLAPLIPVFYRRLRAERPKMAKMAMAGAALLAIGATAAVAIGALAPFTEGYSPLHVQLAFVVFIAITAGAAILLSVAGATKAAVFDGAVVLFLIYLYFTPVEFFHNDQLSRSLAFCEWVLCASCGASLWILERRIERAKPEVSPPTPMASIPASK
jgi:hypothetical membrane protein